MNLKKDTALVLAAIIWALIFSLANTFNSVIYLLIIILGFSIIAYLLVNSFLSNRQENKGYSPLSYKKKYLWILLLLMIINVILNYQLYDSGGKVKEENRLIYVLLEVSGPYTLIGFILTLVISLFPFRKLKFTSRFKQRVLICQLIIHGAFAVIYGLSLYNYLVHDKGWTDEKRASIEKQRIIVEKECSIVDTFNNVIFVFKGFDNDEFDSVLVKEYSNTILVDSFKVHVGIAKHPYDRKIKSRGAVIKRTMNTNNEYHFYVPGQDPYVLANMDMIVWSERSPHNVKWICVMAEFTLDGVKINHTNPTFIKRDTI